MQYNNRKSIPKKYKWDLEKIFDSEESFDVSFEKLRQSFSNISKFRDRLKDKSVLLECLKAKDKLANSFEKLYVYANMKSHEDIGLGKYQELSVKINLFASKLFAEISYITPEIIKNYSEHELQKMAKESQFADYSYMLEELARRKQRVLSEKEEKILAEINSVFLTFSSNFSKYDNVDVKLEDAVTEKGKAKRMTHGNYSVYMQSKDRALRRSAHNSMMSGYKSLINVLSSNYLGNVQSNVFNMKIRGYASALEHSMDSENISKEVYNKLLEKVTKSIPLLKKYICYRKKKLGIGEHKAYDMYANIEKTKELKFDFDEAFDAVVEGLAPLGKEYRKYLDTARFERWIDVYETKGKRSGGYSWGCYGTCPYILLNYNGTLKEVFTLAHELGHSIHSYLSDSAQPYAKAQYEIFVAEIASTVNEMLVIRHMLGSKPSLKQYLLTYLLDMFKGTVFRQSLFAEFELAAHEIVEKEQGLSADVLCNVYEQLNVKYYGKGYITPLIKYEWARIPHFYNAFYVYKYATGLIAATKISEDIYNKKEGAVDDYIRFLSAGGSASPLEILKLAKVDLLSDEPYEKAFGLFEKTLEELKNI